MGEDCIHLFPKYETQSQQMQDLVLFEGQVLTNGGEHADTLGYARNLGWLLQKQGKLKDAGLLIRRCYEGRKKTLEENHWLIADAQSMLGHVNAGQNRFAEAERLQRESYDQIEPPAKSADHKIEALNRVIELYESWHKAEPGKGYDAKAKVWKAKLKE